MAGHLTYRVNVIKLKREIIWTGGLPHLSGLPHLPGVPRLRVNRPLDIKIKVDSSRAEMNTLQPSKPYMPNNNRVN